ncbi:MAG TPA: hypothetical protein VL522_20065 [Bordetella sp.]|nr:hypothetical protein [Bordetella sp.]
MPIPDFRALARQRLNLMQQSGVSRQIATTQMAHRQAGEAARQARLQDEGKQRSVEFNILKSMLLLIHGAEQIRAAGNGADQTRDYQQSKQLIATLVDTSPVGEIGKRQNWRGAVATAGTAVYAAVPTTIKAAGGALANLTGVNGIQTATAVAVRGTEIVDATLTAATVAPVSLPPGVSAAAGSNTNLIQSCLGWWMSPAVAATVATYAPFLNILSAVSTGLAVYTNHQKIDAMLALGERHRGTCACGECIAKIADAWQGDVARTAAGLSPGVGLGLVIEDTVDKLNHYRLKKFANKDGNVHRDSYHLATELWLAVQNRPAIGHSGCRNIYPGLNNFHRCPLAMLAIALLFGNGHAAAGVAKAAAAIVSERNSAVNRIKNLIAG